MLRRSLSKFLLPILLVAMAGVILSCVSQRKALEDLTSDVASCLMVGENKLKYLSADYPYQFVHVYLFDGDIGDLNNVSKIVRSEYSVSGKEYENEVRRIEWLLAKWCNEIDFAQIKGVYAVRMQQTSRIIRVAEFGDKIYVFVVRG